MNTKNRLIEKLLKVAKEHKILTYPVLALVAVISVFHYFFSWSTGAGKRVVAVVMVLVMLVSQSYFLTSSASSLVDTEETYKEQQELQEQSEEDLVQGEEDGENQGDGLVASEPSSEVTTESPAGGMGDMSGETTSGTGEAGTENTDNSTETESTATDDIMEDVYSEDGTSETSDVEEEYPVFSEEKEKADKTTTINVTFVAPKVDGTSGTDNVGSGATATVNADGTYTIANSVLTEASQLLLAKDGAGYVHFEGWYKDSGCTQKLEIDGSGETTFSATAQGGTTIFLYATATLLKYQVTVSTLGEVTIGGVEGATEDATRVYGVDYAVSGSSFTLKNVHRTGYTLTGSDKSGAGDVTSKVEGSGQDITVTIPSGSTLYKQTVTLDWKQDPYKVWYATDEAGTGKTSFEVDYDDENAIIQQPSSVSSEVALKPGYEFSHWTIAGTSYELQAGQAIASYSGLQTYLYENQDAVLMPAYTYNGIELTENEARFQYHVDSEPVVIKGQYKKNSGSENFSYKLISDVTTLSSQNGIVVQATNEGIEIKTVSGGPILQSSGEVVEFEITDNNATDEKEKVSKFSVTIYVDQCGVIATPTSTPTKTYDGTTDCTGLPAKIPVTANGKVVEGVYVTYTACAYDSADAGNRSIILTGAKLVGDSGVDLNNYTLTNQANCVVSGKINKRRVFVKTTVSYWYDVNYVRTGEKDPKIEIKPDDAQNGTDDGFLGEDANSLNDWAAIELKPARDDSTMKTPGEEKEYQVWVQATENSNYTFSQDTSGIATFKVRLPELTDNLYQITTEESSGWLGGSGTIQLKPIVEKGYDQIQLADGEWQAYITLTEELNGDITFRLRNSVTGAYTATRTMDVQVDQNAPEYQDFTVTSESSGVTGGGLFFPSEGQSVSLGNYYNKTVTFAIRYKDALSAPATLYYSLNGTLGGSDLTVPFGAADAEGYAVAQFEILADAVDKIGTIQFNAEDKAGNREGEMRELKKNESGVWCVETTGPTIVSSGVKSGEVAIKNNDLEHYYSNCTAYVVAKDMTAGVYGITWYINDTPYTEVESVAGDTEVTFEMPINYATHATEDGVYTVYAVVTDNAGNNSQQTPTYTFKVDDDIPVVKVYENYDSYQQKVKLEFDAYDTLSGINYVKIEYEDGGMDCTVQSKGKNDLGYDVLNCYVETVTKGDYHIEAVDYAGNKYERTVTLDKVSSEVPPCPEITFSPEVNENGWITDEDAIATITNVTETVEDGTPVDTNYQLWKEGESSLHITTVNTSKEEIHIPNGVYNLKVWSESATGVLCEGSEPDGHMYTIQVDSVEPTIEYQLEKGADNSLLVNFTVKDDVSGVNAESIQVLNGTYPVPVQIQAMEDETGYTGSFEITEIGSYSIVAEDIAGNSFVAPAFKPMSMKVNAVKNISATSVTLGAKVYKGSYDITSATISYRKFDGTEYVETDTLPVLDADGNMSISTVLDGLEQGTNYVYKVTAISEVEEVLEYVGNFKTLSDSEVGITVSGTARYADNRVGAITVGLFAGNSCIRAVEVNTEESTTFVFENVPDGNYRVVATDGAYNDTTRVLIESGRILYPDATGVELVLSGRNTSVELTTDDTPHITADNLDSLFHDETNYTSEDKLLVDDGRGTVEFKLYATLMKVSNVTAGEISAMYVAASSKDKIVGAYIDLSLYKIVTDENGNVNRKQVHKLGGGSNVSVTIPLGDLANKTGLEVIRIHQDGDTYTGAYLVDQDNNPSTYTITTSQFSTYAVLYDPEKVTTEATTEEIKDGTLDPSDSGAIHATTEETGMESDSDDEVDEDDKKDDKAESSSVGSLRSSGSAKTGDTTPIAVLFGMMSISIAGFTLLRKKTKEL